jgi:hypothetical protein
VPDHPGEHNSQQEHIHQSSTFQQPFSRSLICELGVAIRLGSLAVAAPQSGTRLGMDVRSSVAAGSQRVHCQPG